MNPSESLSAEQIVEQCQKVMAHAWMVRCFVKESPEAEEFPELTGLVRTVFDTCRALESRVHDPEAYFQALRKRIGPLRDAAAQFRADSQQASTHANFQQAGLSIEYCVEQLQRLLDVAREGNDPGVEA